MKERAALWGIYFAIRGLEHAPAYLSEALKELEAELDGQGSTRDPARLRIAGSGQLVEQRKDVGNWKFEHETLIGKVVTSAQAVAALERMVGDPYVEIITLEDLTRFRREQIAAAEGVGPKTLAELDNALRDRGLSWSAGLKAAS